MGPFFDVVEGLARSPFVVLAVVLMIWSVVMLCHSEDRKCHIVVDHDGPYVGHLICTTHNFSTTTYSRMQDHLVNEMSA